MIARHTPHEQGPVDASMSVLNDVVRSPLDPAYRIVAARKDAGLDTGNTWVRAGWVLALAILLGALTATSVVTLRTPRDGVVKARVLLESRIERGRAEIGTLHEETATVNGHIEKLQQQALASSDPHLLASLAEYGLASGAVAVSGPGVRVTLDDAAAIREDPANADPKSRIQASDVQEIVNGLWSSGAEAVAVNGERLTSVSAVRGAGLAILVDLTPLAPPYTIEAIGDPQALRAGFSRTSANTLLQLLGEKYAIPSSISLADELTLAGAGSATLRYAEPYTGDGTSSSAPPIPSDAAASSASAPEESSP